MQSRSSGFPGCPPHLEAPCGILFFYHRGTYSGNDVYAGGINTSLWEMNIFTEYRCNGVFLLLVPATYTNYPNGSHGSSVLISVENYAFYIQNH